MNLDDVDSFKYIVDDVKSIIKMQEDAKRKSFEFQVKESKRRLESKEQLIEDLRNEYDLLQEQAVKIYHKNVDYIGFNYVPSINQARHWLDRLQSDEKIDKRKKDPEKSKYEYFNKLMSDTFGIDIVITRIVGFNYDDRGFFYHFTHNNNNYEFYVPIINRINVNDFGSEGDWCFKAHLSIEEHPGVWMCIKASFYLDDFKGVLSEEAPNEG